MLLVLRRLHAAAVALRHRLLTDNGKTTDQVNVTHSKNTNNFNTYANRKYLNTAQICNKKFRYPRTRTFFNAFANEACERYWQAEIFAKVRCFGTPRT